MDLFLAHLLARSAMPDFPHAFPPENPSPSPRTTYGSAALRNRHLMNSKVYKMAINCNSTWVVSLSFEMCTI